MNWSEIIIKVSIKDLEEASAIAQMTAENGIYIEDYSNIDEEIKDFSFVEMIDDKLINKNKTKAFIHIYISPEEDISQTIKYLDERLKKSDIEFEFQTSDVKEEDWVNNWKKYFKPLEVGKKLVIKPSWEQYSNDNDKLILEIDPGMAFGSGTHESTKLCLVNLEKYIKPNTEVLDIGCGSGILSIAALLLGARYVFAMDIDPLAVKIAKENIALNNINSEKYTVIQGDLLSVRELRDSIGKYDLILVNIVADIIISLAPIVKNLLNENGTIICSGIVCEREEDVISALNSHCFEIRDKLHENNWISLVCIAR